MTSTTIPTADPAMPTLTTEQVAELLQVGVQTLVNWRSQGVGPAFARLDGKRVRYRHTDIDAYVAERIVAPKSA